MAQQIELSEWEKQQAKNAKHRALIAQILKDFPEGLTVQQIVEKQFEYYNYTFLADNRLREMRKSNWAESFGDKPQKWRLIKTVGEE